MKNNISELSQTRIKMLNRIIRTETIQRKKYEILFPRHSTLVQLYRMGTAKTSLFFHR